MERDTATTLDLPDLIPGDASWSPDGTLILFSDGPMSTTGSTANAAHGGTHTVRPDGLGLTRLSMMMGGATWTPDGEHVLLMFDKPYLVAADGSGSSLVNSRAMDMTELQQGFIYVAHWLPPVTP